MALNAWQRFTSARKPVVMGESSRPPVRRHHLVVRVTHWLTAVLLAGMIASGLQIYAAFPHFGEKGKVYSLLNPFDSSRFSGFPEWSRLGGWLAGGLNWHFALAWPFVLTGLVYLAYMALSGEWRSLLFRPRDVGPALQMVAFFFVGAAMRMSVPADWFRPLPAACAVAGWMASVPAYAA